MMRAFKYGYMINYVLVGIIINVLDNNQKYDI